MRKKYAFLILALMIVCGAIVWLNRPAYQIQDQASCVELHPLDNVSFDLKADRKGGTLQIKNDTDSYLVIDFWEKPIQLEVLQEDGWHRILPGKIWPLAAEAIPKNSTYSLDFEWRDVIGGPLKQGTYRGILYFGDQHSEIYTYNLEKEFCVD